VTRPSGPETSTEVKIERPVLSGGLGVVERTEQREQTTGEGRTKTTAVTYKRDTNGRLTESAKMTSERAATGDTTAEDTAEYESATTGEVRLVRKTLTRAKSLADGSVLTETEVFEPQSAGKAGTSKTEPKLASRQIVERRVRGDGIVESVSVQFALPNEPNRLGELRKVEETVCTGDCGRK
jgi:hypothetical protein